MKLVIIRHGEPDNEHQTLTPRGFQEAEALGKLYHADDFDEIYVSPLARAQLTARAIIGNSSKELITCPYLAEFIHYVIHPETGKKVLNWDFMPSYFTRQDDLYRDDLYLDTPLMKSANMKEEYEKVTAEFDRTLASHGYIREGKYYRVSAANRKTLLFVCHFGMMGVLLSHLTGIPYILLTQMFACAPTGVTVINSEEREKGIAQFRCARYGDISHLTMAGLEPSFHNRFCETYDSDERH